MTFFYRTPQEELVSKFTAEEQSRIYSPSQRFIESQEIKLTSLFFNYRLSEEQKKFFILNGIELSPFSHRSHSHPACKTLENYFLFVYLPSFLSHSGIKELFLFSIKKAKVARLANLMSDVNLETLNRLVEVKDKCRYGFDVGPERFIKKRTGLDIFLHDELHHWSKSQLVDFLNVHRPRNLLATVVFPIEVLGGFKSSVHRFLYEFTKKNGKLFFYPDGVMSEAYVQTLESSYLFKTNLLRTQNGSYSVSLHRTVGPHHFFQISRFEGEFLQTYRSFGPFDVLDVGCLFKGSVRFPIEGINLTRFKRILIYLMSLKKPDPQSAIAKLRQLCGEDIDLNEMWVVRSLASRIEAGISRWHDISWKTILRDWLLDLCPFKDNLERFGFVDDFDRHLMGIKPLSFQFLCGDDYDYKFEPEEDVPDQMDDIWFGGRKFLSQDPLISQVNHGRPSRTYSFSPDSFTESTICIYSTLPDASDWFKRPRKVCLKSDRSAYNILQVDRFAVPLMICGSTSDVIEDDIPFFPFMEGVREIDDYIIRESILKSMKGNFFLTTRGGYFDPALFLQGKSSFSESFHEGTDGKTVSTPVVSKDEKGKAVIVETSIEDIPECSTKLAYMEESKGSEGKSVKEISEVSDPLAFVSSPLNSMFSVCNVYSDEVLFSTGSFNSSFDVHAYLEGKSSRSLRGRKAFFFHFDGLSYYHDSVLYRTLIPDGALISLFGDVNKEFKTDFNSVLVQVYELESGIKFHRDDEDCYENNKILTLNMHGEAIFEIEGLFVQKLSAFEFVMMKENLQSVASHRVGSTTKGRISMTFRRQTRNPSFEKGLRFLPAVGCLIKAISEATLTKENDIALKMGPLFYKMLANNGIDPVSLDELAEKIGVHIVLNNGFERSKFGVNGPLVEVTLKNGHYNLVSNVERKMAKGIESKPKEYARKISSEDDVDPSEQVVLRLMNAYGMYLNEGQYKLNKSSAQKLLRSLIDGSTGIHCSSVLKDGWKIIPNCLSDDDVRKHYANGQDLWNGSSVWNFKAKMTGIFGFAGSGKSKGIQDVLNKYFKDSERVILISPRTLLADDWREKVPGLKVTTFESALKSNLYAYKWIILDEVTLFPNGYLDLLMLKVAHYRNSSSVIFTLIGDPMQASYFSERDCNLLSSTKMIESVFQKIKYIYQSYRIPMNVANRFDVFDKSKRNPTPICGTFYGDLSSAKKHALDHDLKVEVVLVASEVEKKFFNDQVRCITYGESQGLTFDYGLISLSEETRLCSDNHIYVALTRFRKGFGFFQNFRGDLKSYKSNLGSKLLGRYINLRDPLKNFMRSMTEMEIDFLDDRSNVGAGVDVEYKLSGDPWLKGLVDLSKVEEFVEIEMMEVQSLETTGKVHLPIASINDEFHLIRSREEREFKSLNFDWSMQFEDLGLKMKRDMGNSFCQNFSTIYPRHQASDELTFYAAVKKRLRFSNPATNLLKFKSAITQGRVLLKTFLNYIPIPSEINQNLLDEANREFLEVKLKKSEGTIAGNSNRSDPDWSWDKIFLFMKSQQCTKFEKRFVDAKAGQTLACFSHEILTYFSPWCRYMEKVFSKCCPENFYIHQRKDFEQLNDFSKKYCTGGFCIESDYEAFDVSQDHTVLAFEVLLMEHMRLPSHVIDAYIRMKTELGCRLGRFAIMRFTGEFCTFLFNTFCNMAFTFLRYHVEKTDPICFAGDDMCALRDLKYRSDSDSFLKNFSLKAKVCRTNKPLFCGWRLTKFGLYKEPVLIFERLKIAQERDQLDLVIESYFLEFTYAYRLGSWLDFILDESQSDYQQRLARFFVKKKHLLKGKSAEQIQHCLYLSDGSDEEDCSGFWEDRKRGYSNSGVALKFHL